MDTGSINASGMTQARGQAAQSIGQLARQAVSQARENAQVARSAQGQAASGLAGGEAFEAVVAKLSMGQDVPASAEVAGPADATARDPLSVPQVTVSPLRHDMPEAADPWANRADRAAGATIARDVIHMLFGRTEDV